MTYLSEEKRIFLLMMRDNDGVINKNLTMK